MLRGTLRSTLEKRCASYCMDDPEDREHAVDELEEAMLKYIGVVCHNLRVRWNEMRDAEELL